MSLWVGVCVAIVVFFRLVFGVVPGRPIVRRRRATCRTLLVFTLAGAMFALAGSGTATAATTSLTGTYDGGAQHAPAHSGGYDSPGASSSARWTHGGVTGAPVTAFAVRFAAEAGSGPVSRLRGMDWADDTGAIGSGSRLTTSQATQMAQRVGYRPTNFISRGERVGSVTLR